MPGEMSEYKFRIKENNVSTIKAEGAIKLSSIISIGSAPSSGSTFLADLLDSVPNTVCPPELYTLCAPRAYAFDEFFKQHAIASDLSLPNASIYGKPRPWFNRKHFDTLGIDQVKFKKFVKSATCLSSFFSILSSHLSVHLDRSIQIFFEKTPVNIGTAKVFLSHFPEGRFVFVVRNGFSVVRSLMRRGFSEYEAALLWLFSLRMFNRLKDDRAILIKYEDVVNNPFEEARDLALRIGINASSTEIEINFQDNAFRNKIPRPKVWTYSSLGSPKAQKNVDPFTTIPSETLAFLSNLTLHDITKKERTGALSFRLAMNNLGYEVPAIAPPSNHALWAAERNYLKRRKDSRWHPWRLSFDDTSFNASLCQIM